MNAMIDRLLDILLTLPAVLLALSVHEMCHGYAAYKLGDPTPKVTGRLSLNPLKHLDPLGFISLLLFRFGWARPVMVNSRYFDKPKRDMAITALAGPLSNFLLAFLFSFVTVLLERIGLLYSLFSITEMTPYNVLYIVVYMMVPINLGLGVFNLIPVPPLDGSKILYMFLPNKLLFKLLPYEKYFQLFLILLLFAGILSTPIGYVANFLESSFMNIANGVLDLCLPIN